MLYGLAEAVPPPLPPVRFELPNFHLRGYPFFKPNPYAPKGAGMNDSLIVRNYKRASAVARYFKNLFLGNPDLYIKSTAIFDPTAGRRWRPDYIRKFGYRGERLTQFLGSGPTKEQLMHSLGSVY